MNLVSTLAVGKIWSPIALGVVVIGIQVLEKTLSDFWLTSFIIRSSSYAYSIYVTIILISISLQFIFLYFYGRGTSGVNFKSNPMKVFYYATITVQLFIASILIYSIIDMARDEKYDKVVVTSTLLMSYSTAFFFLAFLARRLMQSFFSSKNKIVLLYAIAVICLAFNIVVDLLYLEMQLYARPDTITPFRNPYGSYGSIISSNTGLIFSYQIAGIVSFSVTWLATALLMKNYSRSLGNFKYWAIVSIPLVYFLGQFFPYIFGLLNQLSSANPILFSLVYNSIVNSVRSAGGILFGFAFFVLAREVRDQIFQRFLILSGVGIMLIFGSINTTSLILSPYPPFGIASISFIGVASYLLLSGLSNTGSYVANDVIIRRALQKNLQKFNFIDSLGFHQIEQSVSHKVDSIMKNIAEKIDMSETPANLEDEELADYLAKVIQEKEREKKSKGLDGDQDVSLT
jgi:hypothetical protein